ncbi:MAG: hypothetical protein QNK42_09345 [Pseudodonghicola sp.]|nr:hypothetical protein [Pseudodonghicola sp.]
MIPTALPSTWPRTFTVLGLGASCIFLTFLWSDRANESDATQTLLISLVGPEYSSPTFAVFFFALASYVVGEIAMIAGAVVAGFKAKEEATKRAARVAFFQNSLLASSVKSKTNAAELIFSLCFLLVVIAFWFGLLDILEGRWSGSILQIAISLVVGGAMRNLGFILLSSADAELSYFEELISDNGRGNS